MDIIQCDVKRCVICISNNAEYLNKKESFKILPNKLYCEFD